MFKKSILVGILALALVTMATGELLAWGISFGGYGCGGLCSYEGDVTITGAKGSSVAAGTVSVAMQQVVEQGHVLGFCSNPQGKINPIGQSFRINTTAFAPVGAGDCDTKGKCPVTAHQATTVLDLPAVCSDSNPCPAVCSNGDSAETCLGKIYLIDTEAVCNNNFSFFGLTWDQVNLTFNVIDLSSASNPVATLNVICTSPDGLVLDQPSPFNCVVQGKKK